MTQEIRALLTKDLRAGGVSQGVTILALAVIALVVAPQVAGGSVTTFNVYNIFQVFADYGLVALALGLVIIAGEYDLSTAGAFVIGGIVAVKLGVTYPALGVLAGLGVGLLAGLVQGPLVAKLGLSAIPVTLGGYLVLIGAAHVISNSESLSYANFDVGEWLDRPVASILSMRSIIVLVVFLGVALLLHFTRLGPELRSVGGDRRASRTAGVSVGWVLVGVLAVSGALSGLGGALTSYHLASANPDLGLGPLIFGTIAALLGGVSLAGGRGSAIGVAAGVFAYATLRETLAIVGAPPHVSDLVTGSLLALVAIATATDLRRQARVRRTQLEHLRHGNPRMGL